MNPELTLMAAFTVGLLGSGHCMAMCGGISSALSVPSVEESDLSPVNKILTYHLGRLAIYTIFGFVAGWIGGGIASLHPLIDIGLRVCAGLMLIAMALSLSNWWQGVRVFERYGAKLWRKIQPKTKKLLPVKTYRQALLLGMFWGFLPCAMVYSTLTWAIASANPFHSAGLMFAFGLGTMPALLGLGLTGGSLLHRLRASKLRYLFSVLMVLLGLQTALAPAMMSHDGHHDHHEHHHKGHNHSMVSPMGISNNYHYKRVNP